MKIECMVPRIKLLMSAFVAVLFFASCSKEYSLENGGVPLSTGTAAFTFTGAPAACAGAVVNGTYTASSPLTASNTVSVQVNVTTPGTYTVFTATTNGITFGGSGTFTATGSQTITLTGSGTPTSSGVFNYNTSSTGCGFSVTVVPAGPVAAISFLDCANTVPSGVYTQYIALASTNTVSIPVTVTTAGSYSVTTTVGGVTFSGAGVLAAGAQNLVLTGSGTSSTSGAVSFPISLGASNCGFFVTFLPGTTPATDYLRCSVDGVATTFNVNLLGAVGTPPIGSGFSIDGDESTAITTASLSLNLINLTGSVDAGTYNLASVTPPSTSFCQPIYNDANAWNQTPTSPTTEFTVIVTAKTANRITGTFSGVLHNSGNNAITKTFTNGEFSVPY